MSSEKRPYELIRELVVERASWSDAEVLRELEQLPPLADEDDPVWNDGSYWREFAYRYVALCDLAAERKMRSAVPLLLERACNGDPGESMRGLINCFEEIFDADWTALADVCAEMYGSKRPGTRLWAIHQLSMLPDPRVRQVLDRAINDEIKGIRDLAVEGLEILDRDIC